MGGNLNLNGTLRYGGGEVTDISASQMLKNELAIQQLINNHNLVARSYGELQKRYEGLIKKSAGGVNRFDIALLCSGFSLIGTITVAVGVNMVTSDKPSDNLGWCVVALGAMIIFGVAVFQLFATHSKGGSDADEE